MFLSLMSVTGQRAQAAWFSQIDWRQQPERGAKLLAEARLVQLVRSYIGAELEKLLVGC
jgi:hypothetical protein